MRWGRRGEVVKYAVRGELDREARGKVQGGGVQKVWG